MIYAFKTVLTKSAVSSALLHIGVFGAIGGLSTTYLDQYPRPSSASIQFHFTQDTTQQAQPTRLKSLPFKTPRSKPKPLSEKHKARARCTAQTVRQQPPTDIQHIACKGAYMPQPRYPKYALKKKLTGLVKIQFQLTPQGLVTSARIHQSSHHKRLDQAALDAIKTWSFPPHIATKYPYIIAPIRFVL